jgi:signal transduction histidine kinase
VERQRLLAALGEAEERERRQIASDVHDGPLQKLAAVGLRLSALRERLVAPAERTALEDALGAVGEATAALRHLLFELRPASLSREGLASALREHLAHLGREAGFRWRVEDGLGEEPPPEFQWVAFRVSLEALANVREHARAREVVVRLDPCEGGGIRLGVQDDGVGFDPTGVGEPPDHFGLADMRDRAETAGGWLRIDSAPEQGTRVECFLPLRSPGASGGSEAEPAGPGAAGLDPPSYRPRAASS